MYIIYIHINILIQFPKECTLYHCHKFHCYKSRKQHLPNKITCFILSAETANQLPFLVTFRATSLEALAIRSQYYSSQFQNNPISLLFVTLTTHNRPASLSLLYNKRAHKPLASGDKCHKSARGTRHNLCREWPQRHLSVLGSLNF